MKLKLMNMVKIHDKKVLVLDKKKKMDKMSESMPEILKIHDEKYREIYWNIDKNKRNLLIYKFS